MKIEEKAVIGELREICENPMPFRFDINNGTYIRKQKTVTDTLKYGEILGELSDELVGLLIKMLNSVKESKYSHSQKFLFKI